MGMIHAAQQGDIPMSKLSKTAKKVAKTMKPKDAKDFASTDTKNLPEKAPKKESLRLTRTALQEMIREMIKEALSNYKEGDSFKVCRGQKFWLPNKEKGNFDKDQDVEILKIGEKYCKVKLEDGNTVWIKRDTMD